MPSSWSNRTINRLYLWITGVIPFLFICWVLVSYLRHTRGRWGLATLRSLPAKAKLTRLFLVLGFAFALGNLWLQALWTYFDLQWEMVTADCIINAPYPNPGLTLLTVFVSVFATLGCTWPYFVIILVSYPVRVSYAFWLGYVPVILVFEYFVYGSCLTLEVSERHSVRHSSCELHPVRHSGVCSEPSRGGSGGIMRG
jgi:hypothetical protein